ncbi:unnamed protein product [Schistocephalus solidus]|uniref:Nucleoplasmin domain-containing protein n=1 Tax=Schistocephalus solidus TaxID=70667 RepID=A0A183SL28_SCHSO|nr:unnamed protein product [Schistocephalus solidus]
MDEPMEEEEEEEEEEDEDEEDEEEDEEDEEEKEEEEECHQSKAGRLRVLRWTEDPEHPITIALIKNTGDGDTMFNCALAAPRPFSGLAVGGCVVHQTADKIPPGNCILPFLHPLLEIEFRVNFDYVSSAPPSTRWYESVDDDFRSELELGSLSFALLCCFSHGENLGCKKERLNLAGLCSEFKHSLGDCRVCTTSPIDG